MRARISSGRRAMASGTTRENTLAPWLPPVTRMLMVPPRSGSG